MAITDRELIELNKHGFIPGPNETEKDFISRVEYSKNLKVQLASDHTLQLPLELSNMPSEMAEPVNAVTKKMFDIVLDWVPIVFSNYRMSLWHGGCAWIYQMTEDTPMTAFFQLRSSFAISRYYLGFYDREEILAHESAHVGRMMFQDPKFEEVFAYRTAKSDFRRYFGPILQSPWESTLFLLVLFLCIIGEVIVTLYGTGDGPWDQSLVWLKGIAFVLILAGLGRVYLRQKQLLHCLDALTKTLGSAEKADAVSYRLQDDEVIAFGKMTPYSIRKYAEEQAPHTLRWRLIYQAYFS